MSSRNATSVLRPLLSGTTLTAGLAVALTGLSTTVNAQTVGGDADPQPQASGQDAVTLEPVNVESNKPRDESNINVNAATTGSSRMAGSVKDTPQVINVVPQEIIKEQHATSLEQVLRNVPGITISSGEGRGGQIGDQFRIRGLSAAGDIYTDGLKDFGVYTHDVFDTESVDVVKGPSGESFGVGNSGGVINQVSKRARLADFGEIDQSIGSGLTWRTTMDVNRKIDETSAVRINTLYHWQNTPDRDHNTAQREGIALNYAAGIGTDTNWDFNYSYLKGRSKPDQGVSMVKGTDNLYRPATEYGLKQSTSYARNLDRDLTEDHVVTSLLNHQFNDNVSVYNDSRFSRYSREFVDSNPTAITLAKLQTPGALLSYGAGGGMAYQQEGWGVQNVTGAKIDSSVLGRHNKLNTGIDLNFIDDNRKIGTWTGRTANQTIVDPTYYYANDAHVDFLDSSKTRSMVSNSALFANDRQWLSDQWSVQGGLRADYFRSSYDSNGTVARGTVTNRLLSPSGSLIFEPTRNSSIYATYSYSSRPQGTDVAQAVNLATGTSTGQTPNGNPFSPEKTTLYEVGAKADFLNERLGVNGAVYRLDKSNSYFVDSSGSVSDGFSEAGLGERINGVEMGVSGKITDAWKVFASYALMTGRVTASLTSPTAVGNDAPDLPKNNYNLWTTYDIIDHVSTGLPGKITIGGGVQYASGYWADSANTALIPYTFSVDSMVSYEDDKWSLALNGYNLTDHLNYSSSFGSSRAVPAAGRTVMMTAGFKF